MQYLPFLFFNNSQKETFLYFINKNDVMNYKFYPTMELAKANMFPPTKQQQQQNRK